MVANSCQSLLAEWGWGTWTGEQEENLRGPQTPCGLGASSFPEAVPAASWDSLLWAEVGVVGKRTVGREDRPGCGAT